MNLVKSYMRWSCWSFSWVNTAPGVCVLGWVKCRELLFKYRIIFFSFTKPISDYGKMLKYQEKIGTPICRSISCCLCLLLTERGHFNIPVLLHALWEMYQLGKYFSWPCREIHFLRDNRRLELSCGRTNLFIVLLILQLIPEYEYDL